MEADMIDFRIPAAAMVLVGLTLCVAAAEGTVTEDLSRDTSMQHHLWSQKFADPQTTGSTASPAISSIGTSSLECIPAGLAFSNPPFLDWHIGSCS
jgi:hypothetical protein